MLEEKKKDTFSPFPVDMSELDSEMGRYRGAAYVGRVSG